MIKFFRLFVSNILVYSYLWTSVYLLLLLVEGVTIIHSKRIIYLARMSVFFLILLLALRLANFKNVAGKKLSLPASWIRFMIIFVFFSNFDILQMVEPSISSFFDDIYGKLSPYGKPKNVNTE